MTTSLRPSDPDRIGLYELVARLGEGGQGTVYLARGGVHDQVAIKLLHRADERARHQFLEEAAAARRVARFCTAQVLDAGMLEDRPYLVSEYVEGPSLRDQVARDGPMGPADLERLAVGTATALMAIHQADLVHRDFKPQNVILGRYGPRVIDFGLAYMPRPNAGRHTEGLIGTPAYMAPEQFGSEPAGPGADMWAWAVTLLFAARGREPFVAESLVQLAERIRAETPDLSVLPEKLRTLVGECLEKNPTDRPMARQVLLALVGRDSADMAVAVIVPGGEAGTVGTGETAPVDEAILLSHGSVSAMPPEPAAPPPRRGRRSLRTSLRLTLLVAVAAVVVVSGVVAAQFKGGQSWMPLNAGPPSTPENATVDVATPSATPSPSATVASTSMKSLSAKPSSKPSQTLSPRPQPVETRVTMLGELAQESMKVWCSSNGFNAIAWKNGVWNCTLLNTNYKPLPLDEVCQWAYDRGGLFAQYITQLEPRTVGCFYNETVTP